MIKEIYTQLCLHNQMSGINTIVFIPTVVANEKKENRK